MNKEEKVVAIRLLRKLNRIQRKIDDPNNDPATDEEVLALFDLLWTCTATPKYKLPSKSVVEQLAGWYRGCEDGYCYISGRRLASIIREASHDPKRGILLSHGAERMSDMELYSKGHWNFKPSPLVDFIFEHVRECQR